MFGKKYGMTIVVAALSVVSLTVSARAQLHGVTIAKGCDGPVCDGEVAVCEVSFGYNDDFGDTLRIHAAWDVADVLGDRVRIPAMGAEVIGDTFADGTPIGNDDGVCEPLEVCNGSLRILSATGNTTCFPDGPFPCEIGPGGSTLSGLPGDPEPGLVSFISDTYVVEPDDTLPLRDQVNIQWEDLCDAAATMNCGGGILSLAQAPGSIEVTRCTDGNECTENLCSEGICSFVPECDDPIDCEDGNACTDDICTPEGCCENLVIPCDDGDVCTADSCDPASGCVFDDISDQCDDSDACTADTCDPITGCFNEDISDQCDDGNACTIDSCDPVSGCVNEDVSDQCDDGNACTADTCDPAIGCVNTDISDQCDDGNACTADSCDPAIGCVNTDISDQCDDSDVCTEDSCDPATGCVNTDISDQCDDSDVCTADSCDPVTGCVNTDISDQCDDSDVCTEDSCDPVTGCVNTDISDQCDDGNVCTSDTCDPITGCFNEDISDQCDDGNACTDDSCDPVAGCVNEDISDQCDDQNLCTEDSCDPATGCVFTDTSDQCDDGNECTVDSCDPATGCVAEPECATAADCNDFDPCTEDFCTPEGCCDTRPLVCDDGNACTNDSCAAGFGCRFDPILCDDGNSCTLEQCNPSSGECEVINSVVCNDNDPCTIDSCDDTLGCTFEPLACCGVKCPPTTKAEFAIWNMNERRFSGTTRCIESWDAELLSTYTGLGTANNFWRNVLQTDRGIARIDGVASSVCGFDSVDAALIGVAARTLTKDGRVAKTGRLLPGFGNQEGAIDWELQGGPDPGESVAGVTSIAARDPAVRRVEKSEAVSLPDNLRLMNQVAGVPSDPSLRGGGQRKGSFLMYPYVEIKWDRDGNVIQDTFIELTNDYPEEVRVQLYLIHGDLCIFADNSFDLTANQPMYWSAMSGQPAGLSPWTVLSDRCPDDDPSNPGGFRLRGHLLIWAIDRVTGEEIRWNHLSGAATVVGYGQQTAWEYNAWAAQAKGDAENGGILPGETGLLSFDGLEYETAPDQLIFDFFASGSVPAHGFGGYAFETELILVPLLRSFTGDPRD